MNQINAIRVSHDFVTINDNLAIRIEQPVGWVSKA
jgi:hypothetical protein